MAFGRAALTILKRMILNDPALKLLSLALAFIIWFSVTSSQPTERIVSAPVEYRNIPQHLELSSELRKSVDVYIRSRRENLSETDFAVVVDLEGAAEGERILRLTPENVRAPFGVQVLMLRPAAIALSLERTISKAVPIEPVLMGKPAYGYRVAAISVSPESITISGPKSRLERISKVVTERVVISDRTQPLVAEVGAVVESPWVRIQDPQRIRVTVQIEEERRDLVIKGIPISVTGAGRAVILKPDKIDATISMPVSLSQQLEPSDFIAIADLSKLGGDNRFHKVIPHLKPKFEVAPSVRIISTSPLHVWAKIVSPEER